VRLKERAVTAELFRTLFDYNHWANEKVLSESSLVPKTEYFADAPGLSFGNLHATLVHILVAELVWLARWQGVLPPDALKDARQAAQLAETQIRSFEELRTRWSEEETKQRTFFSTLTDSNVGRQLSYKTQYGEPNTQPLDQLMCHVINHGTQFRAEAAVRLTQLGKSPGDLDLIVYLRQATR
jgi:uncharacterized damage-inducible protein DinB